MNLANPALMAGVRAFHPYAEAKAPRRYSYRFAKRTLIHEHRRGIQNVSLPNKHDNTNTMRPVFL